jgi:hypothetical protein
MSRVQHKRKTIPGAPVAADVLQGEIVLNITPGNVGAYTKDAADNIAPLFSAPGTGMVSAYRSTGATLNRWYSSPQTGTGLTTASLIANRVYAIPFIVAKQVTCDRIGLQVTNGTASSTVRLAIYQDDGNLYPNALVADFGTVSTASNGVQTITISQTLSPGLYWLACVSGLTPILRGFAVAGMVPLLGLPSTFGTALGLGWSVTDTGAITQMPAVFPAGAVVITNVPIPYVAVRLS